MKTFDLAMATGGSADFSPEAEPSLAARGLEGVRTLGQMVQDHVRGLHVTLPRWTRGCGSPDDQAG